MVPLFNSVYHLSVWGRTHTHIYSHTHTQALLRFIRSNKCSEPFNWVYSRLPLPYVASHSLNRKNAINFCFGVLSAQCSSISFISNSTCFTLPWDFLFLFSEFIRWVFKGLRNRGCVSDGKAHGWPLVHGSHERTRFLSWPRMHDDNERVSGTWQWPSQAHDVWYVILSTRHNPRPSITHSRSSLWSRSLL